MNIVIMGISSENKGKNTVQAEWPPQQSCHRGMTGNRRYLGRALGSTVSKLSISGNEVGARNLSLTAVHRTLTPL